MPKHHRYILTKKLRNGLITRGYLTCAGCNLPLEIGELIDSKNEWNGDTKRFKRTYFHVSCYDKSDKLDKLLIKSPCPILIKSPCAIASDFDPEKHIQHSRNSSTLVSCAGCGRPKALSVMAKNFDRFHVYVCGLKCFHSYKARKA